MREHPNAVVVRTSYEAVARRDESALATLVASGCETDAAEALGSGGDADDAWALTPLAMAAAGNLVVVIDHLCARSGGHTLDVEGVAVFRLEDGRIVEVRRM